MRPSRVHDLSDIIDVFGKEVMVEDWFWLCGMFESMGIVFAIGWKGCWAAGLYLNKERSDWGLIASSEPCLRLSPTPLCVMLISILTSISFKLPLPGGDFLTNLLSWH